MVLLLLIVDIGTIELILRNEERELNIGARAPLSHKHKISVLSLTHTQLSHIQNSHHQTSPPAHHPPPHVAPPPPQITTDTADLVIRPLVEQDSQSLQRLLPVIPIWVKNPDIDRVDWLNKFIETMWPYLDKESLCADAASFDLPSWILSACISEPKNCVDLSIARTDNSNDKLCNPDNFAILGGYSPNKENQEKVLEMTSLRGLAEIFWYMEKKLYYGIEVT
ncbi:uncharacterized protein LOC114259020 [Camellia sinensis]|uniref:uncharacterized protein LOC114259020 n=1 Tax=Camellia sinensis TaxID=4442 RepID=UPI00103691A9|nr:uncharacterized protein LOC114259020 [Camellia sinensis]